MYSTATFRNSLVLTTLLVVGLSVSALAQSDRKSSDKKKDATSQVRVKVIERTDAGGVREIERTYRADGMKDEERDALVNRLVDSLRAKRSGERGQLTIIVEDDGDGRVEIHQDNNGNRASIRQGRTPQGYVRRPDIRREGPYEFRYYRDGRLQNRWNFNPDSLADRMRRFEFSFPRDWSRRMDDAFRDWNLTTDNPKASTIRGLQAYPNNPDSNELNIRFTAPEKGDVSIRVTTPEGKEVARKEVKNFSGDYVGQVDIGKKAKGVYFVQVTQKEDGAVRRVVVE